jgi:AcrR family transcriptional regulator
MSDVSQEKKEDLRTRRTNKLLLEALITLLEEKSFEEIYVKDICDRAMIHRTTFYKHFEDKYHLLRFGLSVLEKNFDQASLARQNASNLKEYYLQIFKQLLYYLEENKRLSSLILVNGGSNASVTLVHKLLAESVTLKLQDLSARQLPAQIIAEFHVGAFISVIRWWVENKMPLEADKLVYYMDFMITHRPESLNIL